MTGDQFVRFLEEEQLFLQAIRPASGTLHCIAFEVAWTLLCFQEVLIWNTKEMT